MSIWNKVLVGLISVASLALFYLAARAMKTEQYWRELSAGLERNIAQLDDANEKLREGTGGPGLQKQGGVRQLRQQLKALVVDRGRMWVHCDPSVKVNRDDGTAVITATIDQPDLQGLALNTVVYGFEEADTQKQGHYMGEFRVAKTDEKQKQIVLAPTSRLSAAELDRLTAAKRPWEFYETMPRAGKDAQPLRDYQILFAAGRAEYTLLVDQIDWVTRDGKLIEEALAAAKRQDEAIKVELAAVKEDRVKFTKERGAVVAYHEALDKEVAAVNAEVARLIETNKAMAGRIAKLQLEAARRIDERTRAMAQSAAGGR